MLLITCPWCGPRDETEFHYGGQAHVPYPETPGGLSDREWGEFLFFRDNPKGTRAERWTHSAGCRRWFNALRDTVSYEVLAVYRPEEPRPVLHPAPSSRESVVDPAPSSYEPAVNPSRDPAVHSSFDKAGAPR